MIERDIVIGVVCRRGSILICQRRMQDPLGGFWEFPGGKREAHETIEACLGRELREELAIEVQIVRALDPIDHQYANVRVRLYPFLCDLARGEPRPLASQQLRWVAPAALHTYSFPPANESLISRLGRLSSIPANPRDGACRGNKPDDE